jgi:nucleotide-binding universal stress UspA family protein
MSEREGIILAAIDGSQNSLLAAGVGARMASLLGAHLGLIHVLDEPVVSFWGGVEAHMKSGIRTEAEATLSAFADKIAEVCEVTPEFFIEEGLPEEVIPKVVESQPDVMMVVVGRTGLDGEHKSHLRKRSIGHVTSRLIERLALPITVVPTDLPSSHICEAVARLRDAR